MAETARFATIFVSDQSRDYAAHTHLQVFAESFVYALVALAPSSRPAARVFPTPG